MINVLRKTLRQVHGPAGYLEIDGLAQFNANDANGELPVDFANIQEISVNNPIGAPATDETLYVDEAAQVKGGVLTRPAGGTVTVARTGAAPTAGLIFAFRARGY